MSESEPIRDYYSSFAEREWARLDNPRDGAIEWTLTTRRIERHLARSSRVLDIGGGPGRYAIWLAEHGHRVVLADLSPVLLEIASRQIAEAGAQSGIEAVVEADACDLSRWATASFDAALCLGPFYHLPEAARRGQAAAELARVVRPGGTVFVAFMPRLTLLARTIAIADERRHLLDAGWLEALLERGEFINDIDGRFDGGYGARPEEIPPLMESAGFDTISLSSAESISRGLIEGLSEVAADGGELHAKVLQLLDEIAEEPSVLGLANHLLYVGQRQ